MVSTTHKEMMRAIFDSSRQQYIRRKKQEQMNMMHDSPDWHSPSVTKKHLRAWSTHFGISAIGKVKKRKQPRISLEQIATRNTKASTGAICSKGRWQLLFLYRRQQSSGSLSKIYKQSLYQG